MYPNPCFDRLNLIGVGNRPEIVILDLQGRILLSQNSSSTIDVSTLNPGLYLIQIENDQGISTTFQFFKI